jgi:hypothetical protein
MLLSADSFHHGSGHFSFTLVWLARSPLLDTSRLPQQKILDDQIPLAADEWCLATTARYSAINCIRSGFDFDDLIKRVAVRAME